MRFLPLLVVVYFAVSNFGLATCWGANEAATQAIEQALKEGDFATAQKMAERLGPDERDAAFALIVRKQRQNGDYAGAATTAGYIQNAQRRQSTMTGGSEGNGAGNAGVNGAGVNGGGAGQANFDPLMELIRSTVEPDTWVDNGGTSRMQPYEGGIRIDAKGLVSNIESPGSGKPSSLVAQRLADRNLKGAVAQAKPNDGDRWKQPSETRCVSLHAMQTLLAARLAVGRGPDEAMRNLAGIQRLYAVMIPEDFSDVILVGAVGELERHEIHGWIDRVSGRPTVRLEDLTAMLGVVTAGRPIGCSIDPTQQGLAAVQTVANDMRSGKLKGAAANDALAKALGPQAVSVFGIQPDELGSLPLIVADRHMKMVALNQTKMPANIDHYFTLVERMLDQHGLPDGQLLRFWFTGEPIPVARSENGLAFVWDRTPIRLLSEREMADANGHRRVAGQDPRADEFAKQLTEHFQELPRTEPIYGRLAGLFELGLGLALAHQKWSQPEAWDAAIGILGNAEGWQQRLPQPPRLVPSLVASQNIRRAKKQHTVTIISGGINLNPRDLASNSRVKQESRADQLQTRTSLDKVSPTQWWWDN